MAEVKTRPCYVKGRKGLFHRWIEKEDFYIKTNMRISNNLFDNIRKIVKENGAVPDGFETDIVKNTYALIEFEDGHMEEIPPTTITFLDSRGYFIGPMWKEEKEEKSCLTCKFKELSDKCLNIGCNRCKYCIYASGYADNYEPKGESND